jgi:hypothetical protein
MRILDFLFILSGLHMHKGNIMEYGGKNIKQIS